LTNLQAETIASMTLALLMTLLFNPFKSYDSYNVMQSFLG